MSAPAKDRRLRLSTMLENLDYDKLIRECPRCGFFFIDCGGILFTNTLLSHDLAVAITDGACPRNGQNASRAGIGIVAGKKLSQQFSIPWHRIDSVPAGLERTSQRAELFAAIEGLRKVADVHAQHLKTNMECSPPKKLVIATDSEYVVKGLTEWFPSWKKHGNKTSRGVRSVNFDVFEQLEKKVVELEEIHGMEISFLYIPGEAKALADKLARDAAEVDDLTVEANTIGLAQLHFGSPQPAGHANAVFPRGGPNERQEMEQCVEEAMAPFTGAVERSTRALFPLFKRLVSAEYKDSGHLPGPIDHCANDSVIDKALMTATSFYLTPHLLSTRMDICGAEFAYKYGLESLSDDALNAQDEAILQGIKIMMAPLRNANTVLKDALKDAMILAMRKHWNGEAVETKGIEFLSPSELSARTDLKDDDHSTDDD